MSKHALDSDNAKLSAIAKRAGEIITEQINESQADVLQAWYAAAEEAQDGETPAKLRLGFAVTLDLDGNKANYTLSYGIRRKVETAEAIPDPSQPELEMEGRE